MGRGIEGASFEGTGYSYTLSLIRGKHKMSILYCLMEYQPVRFNEMRRYLGGVSDRTLSRSLKELEEVRRERDMMRQRNSHLCRKYGLKGRRERKC